MDDKLNERLQTRKPYGRVLQVPAGMGNEVSLSDARRRCWSAMPRVTAADEVWKEYIKNQTPPEPDDDFTVVWPINPAFSRDLKPPAFKILCQVIG